MLAELRTAIKARLESAYPFRVVEAGSSQRVLQSPPAAVFFLADEDKISDEPEVDRSLVYEIALLVSYTDPVKAQEQIEDIIDAVRTVDQKGPRRLSPFTIPSFLVNLAAGQVSIRHGLKGPLGAPVTACAAR